MPTETTVDDIKEMARRKDIEIWESTIDGTIHVAGHDQRGRERLQTAFGKGSRIRLSMEDREIAEEAVVDQQHNPFRNGMLIHVNPRPDSDSASDNQLRDDELVSLFDYDEEEFAEAAASLSKINFYRLLKMCTVKDSKPYVDTTISKVEFLKAYAAETWPIGGTTPTYEAARRDKDD